MIKDNDNAYSFDDKKGIAIVIILVITIKTIMMKFNNAYKIMLIIAIMIGEVDNDVITTLKKYQCQ